MPVPFYIDYQPQAREYTALLNVGGTVTFREAPELRRNLFRAIGENHDRNVVVELGEVDRMDTAAMAVLLEGLMATREGDPAVFLVGASESVHGVFRLAGFEEALMRCFGCMDDFESNVDVDSKVDF
jgi:anti-anti-sigma factor